MKSSRDYAELCKPLVSKAEIKAQLQRDIEAAKAAGVPIVELPPEATAFEAKYNNVPANRNGLRK